MEDRCYINPFQPRVCSSKSVSSDDIAKSKDTDDSSRRSEMKDSYSLAIACVFDGHNGDYVAEFLKEKFAVCFQNSLIEYNYISQLIRELSVKRWNISNKVLTFLR